MSRNRYDNALFINCGGACNPSGIAHSIVDACKEMRDEPDYAGTDEMRRDPALRLMIHQLCHLMGIITSDCEGGFVWQTAVDACAAKAADDTLAMFGMVRATTGESAT
jgi:hypothetical protein